MNHPQAWLNQLLSLFQIIEREEKDLAGGKAWGLARCKTKLPS